VTGYWAKGVNINTELYEFGTRRTCHLRPIKGENKIPLGHGTPAASAELRPLRPERGHNDPFSYISATWTAGVPTAYSSYLSLAQPTLPPV